MIDSLASQWDGDTSGSVLHDALLSAIRIHDAEEQAYKLNRIVSGMSLRETALAVSYFRELDDMETRMFLTRLLARWAQLDPVSAMAFTEEYRSSHPDFPIDIYYVSVFNEWFMTRPQDALSWFARTQPSYEVAQSLGPLMQTFYRNSPEEAVSTLLESEDVLTQQVGFTALLSEIDLTNIEQQSEFQNFLYTNLQDIQISMLFAEEASRENPSAVTEIMWNLESTGHRQALVTVALEEWLDQDSQAAANWLADKVPHRDLDPAVRAVVMETMRSAPIEAFYWAQSVEDAGEREMLTMLAGRQWMELEPELARTVIEGSAIPQNLKNALLPERQNVVRYEAASTAGQVIQVPAGTRVQISAPLSTAEYRLVESNPEEPLTEEEQRLIEQAVDEALSAQGQ